MAYGTKTAHAVQPEYRTQKAKGVKALAECGFYTPNFDVLGIEAFKKPVDANGQIGMFGDPEAFDRLVGKFVRPCPMVPRHGFVDSRPINTPDEAQKIVEETLAVEDRAEFIVMPFVDSAYSGIWTDGQLVIGKGNDGATAGHSSRAIPTLGVPHVLGEQDWKWRKLIDMAGITEPPYMELLWSQKYAYSNDFVNYFVQLRNGPKLPQTTDYIPAEMEVKAVVTAEGDLLEWETKAKNFTAGTVVYHPGGSLASHYAVHAVINNIPVVISRQPIVGEILKPNTEVKKSDAVAMKAGFLTGGMMTITFQDATRIMLLGAHSTSVWMGKQDFLLGMALGCAYRLIITAALGEFRHQPGRKRKPSRNAVYRGVWDKIFKPSTRTRYLKALASFENDDWPSSYGGKKWLIFARFAGSIYNSILDENVTGSLELLNQAVHAVHNGGWAFDKFIQQSECDYTATSPAYTLLRVAPKLYDAILIGEEKPESGLLFFKGRKHYELDEIDEKEAKKDEECELQDETEESEACECGDHGCEDCYPDGCPNGHGCGQCMSDGCGDEDCTECYPKSDCVVAQDYGKPKAAQVKIIPKDSGGIVLHVQYTYMDNKAYQNCTGRLYATKDVHVNDSTNVARVKKLFANSYAPKVKSLAGNDKPAEYIPLAYGPVSGLWHLKNFGANSEFATGYCVGDLQ